MSQVLLLLLRQVLDSLRPESREVVPLSNVVIIIIEAYVGRRVLAPSVLGRPSFLARLLESGLIALTHCQEVRSLRLVAHIHLRANSSLIDCIGGCCEVLTQFLSSLQYGVGLRPLSFTRQQVADLYVPVEWQDLADLLKLGVDHLSFVQACILFIHLLRWRLIVATLLLLQSHLNDDEGLSSTLIVMLQARLRQHVVVQSYIARCSVLHSQIILSCLPLSNQLVFRILECFGL